MLVVRMSAWGHCLQKLPLATSHLKPFLETIQLYLKHRFIPTLMATLSVLMCLHYEPIHSNYKGCAIPALYGPSQTGKTLTCKLSIVGIQKGLFQVEYQKEAREKWTVSASLTDYVNDIYNGGVVANLRTGPLTLQCMHI